MVALLAITLPAAGAAAAEDGATVTIIRLDAKGALAHDLALRAEGKGWTIEQAEAENRVGEALDVVTSALAAQRPDIFITAKRSSDPGGTPSLYIKGPADRLVLGLVDASPIKIDVVDNQPYSFDELLARRDAVVTALGAMGFQDYEVESNLTGAGVIVTKVVARSDAPASAEEILAKIPADLRSSVDLSFGDLPGRDTTSFGGMLVTAGGSAACTSGWSVTQTSTGTTGVTTAGHCSGTDGIVDPAHPNPAHTFIFQSEHRGNFGDVEWHTTNQAEPDDFYLNGSTISDVSAVEVKSDEVV